MTYQRVQLWRRGDTWEAEEQAKEELDIINVEEDRSPGSGKLNRRRVIATGLSTDTTAYRSAHEVVTKT